MITILIAWKLFMKILKNQSSNSPDSPIIILQNNYIGIRVYIF